MSKYYIIQHPVTNQFFEQDFVGWSWQETERFVYKFSSRTDAVTVCTNLDLDSKLCIKERMV